MSAFIADAAICLSQNQSFRPIAFTASVNCSFLIIIKCLFILYYLANRTFIAIRHGDTR